MTGLAFLRIANRPPREQTKEKHERRSINREIARVRVMPDPRRNVLPIRRVAGALVQDEEHRPPEPHQPDKPRQADAERLRPECDKRRTHTTQITAQEPIASDAARQRDSAYDQDGARSGHAVHALVSNRKGQGVERPQGREQFDPANEADPDWHLQRFTCLIAV